MPKGNESRILLTTDSTSYTWGEQGGVFGRWPVSAFKGATGDAGADGANGADAYIITDNSAASTDFLLEPGAVAYLDFSSTASVPLYIQSEEGVYELDIITDTSGSSVAADTQLQPNNTTYTDAIHGYQIYGPKLDSAASGALSPSGFIYKSSSFMLHAYLPIAKLSVSTFTTGKSLTSTGISRHTTGTQTNFGTYFMYWLDTTTAWTSLGTVVFAQSCSGKIIIRRVL